MKIVVVGGTGLIGRQLVAKLSRSGHEVVAASPSSGVNTLTGAGLAEAFAGADVVVDVSNAPSFEDQAVLSFFRTSAVNIVTAAQEAGVAHLIALSIVGTDRLQASGYFRAKQVQEALIMASGIGFTIVRATQFFEFLGAIADGYTRDGTVNAPCFALQPVASADVVAALGELAVAAPRNGTIEVAGPERAPLVEFVSTWLRERDDRRPVMTVAEAVYFGVPVNDNTLVPGDGARLMPTRFADWLAGQLVPAHA